MTDAEHAAVLRRLRDIELPVGRANVPTARLLIEAQEAIERAIELLELNDKTGIADAYG